MSKLQVNQNIQPKTFLILAMFSILLFFIFFGHTISNYLQTKDYVKLNAIITDVEYRRVPSSSNTSNYSNYIVFTYEYDNETYSNEQKVSFRFNKKVGNSTTIYVNPNNPNEIKDVYITNVNSIMCIFTLVITIFLIKAYIIRKHSIE